MSHKNRFSLLSLIFTVFVFAPQVANGCTCGSKATVLDAYEGSDVVVIAKVVSVEKTDEEGFVDGVKSSTLIVEKVYKGDLKVGDNMTFAQGGGGDCIWTFNEKDIDTQVLFYLHSREKNPKVWMAVTCGRSRSLEYATDDLLYLNKLDKVRGKTRISGTIEFEDEDLSVEGRIIRLIGANKTYQTKTDKAGVYEIYDLPAGKYLIEPEAPTGWKVNTFYLRYSSGFAGDEESKRLKKIPIVLQDKKHAGLDLHFEIDNVIRGKVFDPNGKPMKGVCVHAVLPQDEKEGGYHAACTEADGSFALTETPRGSYILVFNKGGKLSSSEPFKTFYYPNVTEREKAAVITIGAGDSLEGLNVYVPKVEETITLEGVFLYSDGKPVIDESVEFEPADKNDAIEADERTSTDSKGKFSIKILKGVKGRLHGEMYSYIGEFENCPKLDAILKNSQHGMEIKTPLIEIQGQTNLFDVVLKYPFPGCKKAKENP